MARRKANSKRRYFEVDPILKKYPKARYYYILGGRGTGKTYPTMKKSIKDAIDGKGVFALIRRYKESIKTKNMANTLSPHNEWIAEYTEGQWNKLVYWQGCFYLERWEENPDTHAYEKVAKNPVPIGGAWSMNTWENDKGPDFGADKGGFANIILDEALSKGGEYLGDEWGVFQNVIASLVRDRWEQDTKIWLLANPVSKWTNPYFRHMGITKKLISQPGITEIQYPDKNGKPNPSLSTVFAYIAAITDKDGNVIDVDENRTNVYNKFFAFPDSKGKSQSIAFGMWEMEDCSKLPPKYYNDSTKNRSIYLKVDEENITACDIMKYHGTNQYYLFFYPTEKVKEKCYYITCLPEMEKYAIIGSNGISHPVWDVFKQIWNSGRVYYADETTADAVHGFWKEIKKRII